MLQVSCLGVEEHSEEDPFCLVLTSRGPDGSVTRFIMQASSPEIKQAWLDDVVQILETQRNFLNGASAQCFPQLKHTFKSLINVTLMTSPCPLSSSSVSNRVPTQGEQLKQPGQEHEDSNCVSIWPATSLLCIHGATSAPPPAASQHLPALPAPATALPGLEGGEWPVQQRSLTHFYTILPPFSDIELLLDSSFSLKVSNPCAATHRPAHPTLSSSQQLSSSTEVRHCWAAFSGLPPCSQVHQTHIRQQWQQTDKLDTIVVRWEI